MSQLLADRLRKWRGRRYVKEAADILGLPIGTYRKYEEGKRTPNKLALAELDRRLEDTTNADTRTGHAVAKRY